jgi:hypothetical protein
MTRASIGRPFFLVKGFLKKIFLRSLSANEFVGQILSFEKAKEKCEDFTLKDFIAFREENIFGYDPPAKS